MLFLTVSRHVLLQFGAFVETAFLVGFAATLAINRRSTPALRRARWVKFGGYFLITHLMILAASARSPVFVIVIALLASAGAVEFCIATCRRRVPSAIAPIIGCAVYLGASAGTVLFAVRSGAATAVYVYLVVCVLDAYSQIVGQLMGRHALVPALSPHKTVEGAAGGALCAIVTAIVFRRLANLAFADALWCGILLSGAGILADLLSSYYKRLCGIKDYSAALPGQGGVIDRFNSLFAACSIFYLLALAA